MKTLLIGFITLLITTAAQAQHESHQHKADTAKKTQQPAANKKAQDTKSTEHSHSTQSKNASMTDTVKPTSQKPMQAGHDHSGHEHSTETTHGHSAGDDSPMSHAFSRNLPMNRNGSGTAWQPDNSPMYGYMFHSKKWMYMLHGNLFLRYNKQDLFNRGSRGDEKVDAPNMWMFMGQRNVGKRGLFHFNTMLSLDPLTVGEEGYPLLFQTGETYKGKPLIDRQHPHDLISELSVSYAHAFSPKSDLFVYLGYPGEPALGPVAFVHRASGFMNPDAPLTHHWTDATHITFGVATLGFRYGNFKVEASSFTGREPDENRYNFDKPRFDSWSGRLSFNPSAKWALQVSHGFIKEPESIHVGEDVNRTTASVQYSTRGFGETFTNLTALWGMNKTKNPGGEHGLLLEGSHQKRKTAFYGRYEFVQKSGEELGLNEPEFEHDALFPTHAITAGTSYNLLEIGKTRFAVGAQTTLFVPDKRLTTLYGDMPLAGQVYLRIFPGAMGQQSGKLYLPF